MRLTQPDQDGRKRSTSPRVSGARQEPTTTKGILDHRPLPDPAFNEAWDAIILEDGVKDRLLSQAIVYFTLRPKIDRSRLPLHGTILLVGPPGTGKTSLAKGLASRAAESLQGVGAVRFVEVEPHALTSSALGKSQQAVQHLLGNVIAEHAQVGPLIVLLDEVETLAVDRSKLSLEANPVDVHRASDAVLAQLDHLAASYPHLLFVATSNFPQAIDGAFLSRVDLIERIDLPNSAACRKILTDTVNHLAQQFPKAKQALCNGAFEEAVTACTGLDGRAIRKTVLAACARDKRTALDPNRLTASDLLAAAEQAGREQRVRKGHCK